MKYVSFGPGRAFMINQAFAKQFGIPLSHEAVVKTPAQYFARLKAIEEEMRREQKERESLQKHRKDKPTSPDRPS